MNPEKARQLIGVNETASVQELEEVFSRRCQELEFKIERAPTAGLKEKYRRNLSQIEEARDVLIGTGGSSETPENYPTLRPVIKGSAIPASSATTPESKLEKNVPGRIERPILVWIIAGFCLLRSVIGVVPLLLIVYGLISGLSFPSSKEDSEFTKQNFGLLFYLSIAGGVNVYTYLMGGILLLRSRRMAVYIFLISIGNYLLFLVLAIFSKLFPFFHGYIVPLILVSVDVALPLSALLYISFFIRKGVLT